MAQNHALFVQTTCITCCKILVNHLNESFLFLWIYKSHVFLVAKGLCNSLQNLSLYPKQLSAHHDSWASRFPNSVRYSIWKALLSKNAYCSLEKPFLSSWKNYSCYKKTLLFANIPPDTWQKNSCCFVAKTTTYLK